MSGLVTFGSKDVGADDNAFTSKLNVVTVFNVRVFCDVTKEHFATLSSNETFIENYK